MVLSRAIANNIYTICGTPSLERRYPASRNGGFTAQEYSISINDLPAGANVPFVHSHKDNEEVYGILSGKGKVIIDGEEIALTAGDWVRIAPVAKRQFFAAEDEGISFVCIQTKKNSLEGFTADDAVVY